MVTLLLFSTQGWAETVSSLTITVTVRPVTIWFISSRSHPVDIDGSGLANTTRDNWNSTWTVFMDLSVVHNTLQTSHWLALYLDPSCRINNSCYYDEVPYSISTFIRTLLKRQPDKTNCISGQNGSTFIISHQRNFPSLCQFNIFIRDIFFSSCDPQF